ncbi:Protein BOB1 [Talaromyces islandicus]|uniref:Protein BOB1 n=1 Tax=Talaromyces islandicus TaxID=28573 RepID=A0A0U1M569_TALIS|nr:Protein BOB1 [Talaromyces islandicus]
MAYDTSFQHPIQLGRAKYTPPYASRSSNPRPPSEATEIFDTDFESDYDDEYDYFDESPRRSVGSLATESVTTVSTRDVRTPESQGRAGYNDAASVRGPQGPHLFRGSMDSADFKTTMEVDLVLAKTPTTATTFFDNSSDKPRDKMSASYATTPYTNTPYTSQSTGEHLRRESAASSWEDTVRGWSPEDVVSWMRNEGFDDDVINKFLVNDISGSILLELQTEDLKELEIQSFGKRRRLMNAIKYLKNSSRSSTEDLNASGMSSGYTSSGYTSSGYSSTSEDEKGPATPSRYPRNTDRPARKAEDIRPTDSASIVAIEQLLPKEHKCSKGEACRKWQRQQSKLARLAEGLPKDSVKHGNAIIAGDPGNPATAPNLMRGPKSDAVPSIVASSDLLGPQQAPQFRLSEEKLNGMRARDPQESVRQYLNFQHLSKLQPVNDPATPPQEVSPDSYKTSPTLAENLRTLPKLTIPSAQNHAPNVSAQRTITPSILMNPPAFSYENQPYGYNHMGSPGDFYRSSGEYYHAADDVYRQGTPFSEMDVPVTAIPAGPIARDVTQSVPPNMRFGHARMVAEPIVRPGSTKEYQRKQHPTINTHGLQSLGRVEEGKVAVIERPEDMHYTPQGPQTANDAAHSGWMKKRKTTRLLRHEWEDHHFTLKGTQLAMFESERDSHRDSKALEYIDVDDYAVACSSLASNSKLTAAFKKTVLKRNNGPLDDAAFAFSLIPSANGKDSGVERKAFFMNHGKSHHFAVKTRDERIDWMRELMLAKALKRGRESGESIQINGNMF